MLVQGAVLAPCPLPGRGGLMRGARAHLREGRGRGPTCAREGGAAPPARGEGAAGPPARGGGQARQCGLLRAEARLAPRGGKTSLPPSSLFRPA